MKKFLLAIVFLLIASIASAQIFPLTLKVVWTPNPASDNVENYIVTVNGTSFSVTPGFCNADCTASFTITTQGPHTVTVKAVNLFGESVPASITFSAIAPGKSNNVKIIR